MDENQNRTPSGAAADENTEQLAQKLYQTMEQTLRAARESGAEQPAQKAEKQAQGVQYGEQAAAATTKAAPKKTVQSPAAQQDAEEFEVLQAVSVHREAQHNDATDRIPVRQKSAAKESGKPQKKKKEKAAASRKAKHSEKAEKMREAHPMAQKQRKQGTAPDATNRRGTAVRDVSRYFQGAEQTPSAPPPSGGKKGGKAKKKGRGLAALIIALVLVLGIGAGAAALVHHFKNYTPDVAPLPGPGEEQSSDAGTDASGEQIKIPEREQQVYNILITGIDKESHSSDVIMVVRFNAKDGTTDVVQIPRDTYYNYGGYKTHKINAMFASFYNQAKNEGEANPFTGANERFAKFITDCIGVPIDRYVCIDTEGFREVVDAFGGVTIEVPMDLDYDDPLQDLSIHLKKGLQHLDGAQAEGLVRFRSGWLNADIGRIEVQKKFLSAMFRQIKENMNVSTLVKTANIAIRYVTTNMSAEDIVYFGGKAMNVSMEHIRFATMPGGGVTNPNTGASYYVLYKSGAEGVIREHLEVYQGELPQNFFNPKGYLCNKEADYVMNVYNTPYTYVFNEKNKADYIDENEVNVPHK